MAMTYNEVWRALGPEDRLKAGEAFWAENGPQQQGAMQLLAKRYSFRPKTLKALSAERKARMLVELTLPPDITMLLLAAFHLTHRRQLLIDFLDALGIAHKEGFLDENTEATPPTAETMGKAVETVKGKYPAREVQIYFETLYMQDSGFWKELGAYLPEKTAAGNE